MCAAHWAPAWHDWEARLKAGKGGPHSLEELVVQWRAGLADLGPEAIR